LLLATGERKYFRLYPFNIFMRALREVTHDLF